MAQMKHIDSKHFWASGFVVQINEDQYFAGHGPFQPVTLQKNSFQEQLGLNRLLIKPQYWDFLTANKDQTEALQPAASAVLTKKEFQDLISTLSAANNSLTDLDSLNASTWAQNFKIDFTHQFKVMQEWISKGILEKAVPIGRVTTELKKIFQPEIILKNLIADSTARGWIYGFWNQHQGFLGRTPELLFQSFPVDSKTITTMALAGTWPKNPDLVNDYEDPKIWNEHQIVVKDVQNW